MDREDTPTLMDVESEEHSLPCGTPSIAEHGVVQGELVRYPTTLNETAEVEIAENSVSDKSCEECFEDENMNQANDVVESQLNGQTNDESFCLDEIKSEKNIQHDVPDENLLEMQTFEQVDHNVTTDIKPLIENTEDPLKQDSTDVQHVQYSPDTNNQATDDSEYTENKACMNSEENIAEASNIEHCVFVCNQCSDSGHILPATVSCSNCLELYCNECSDDHRSFKTSKSHVLKQHNDLLEKTTCEPCANKNMSSKRPAHLCVDCNEAQCEECKVRHKRLKMARNHVLIPCASISNVHADHPGTSMDVSTERNTNKTEHMRPGKPSVGSITVDRITLAWDPPEKLYIDHSYQLRYKECNTQMKWVFYQETLANPSVTLHNLKSGTQFVFQVRMVDDEHEGPYSELSSPIETIRSAAEHLLEFMYDVENPDIDMQLKKLPLQENKDARNNVGRTRKLYLGEDKGVLKKERTILLVGATGTGKSTLVDGMINYVLGVKWSDPYRLTLVDLEEDEISKHVDQAVSQTKWITCYEINPYSGGRLDYKLNIIDTPGFGDTSGIERDKEIVQQIKHLFSREDDAGVLFIDAICFIIKAPDARLTPTQMYIFNAIMSLFGQDIEDNFSMLITFADGKQPPVLSALKKANLPHDEYFPFNNSGLFADNSTSNESNFSSMFWNMGCHSFEKFFERLSKMETKSLIQTRDVLSQREKIELTMENLLPLVDAGLSKVEETRIEITILNDFQTQIEANSDFTYTVTETQQKQIDLPKGQHVTNCLNCHFTCHQNCAYANDEDKKNCCAMGANGFCEQCPDKCWWDIHRNTPYIFEYISVTKEKTYAEKLEKYRLATDETMTREKVVERMHEEMCDLEDEIFKLMEQINDCNNILRKIALRPDPLSLVEHIDLLIESEKQEKRPGFQRRIASLQQCRRRATIGDEIDRFDAGITDATTQITAQVKLPIKRERKKRTGVLGFFQPVVNYFMKK